MKQFYRVSLLIICLGVCCMVAIHYDIFSAPTSLVHAPTESTPTYFEDNTGTIWTSQNAYHEYEENDYFIAPDGTYWTNEYRYMLQER